jgi:hypothetical protein
METFLKLYIINILIIITFGLVGGFVLFPFRQSLKYPIFAAPFTGILIWTLGISALYSYASFSLANAAMFIGFAGIICTLAVLFYVRPQLNLNWQTLALMLFVLTVIAFVTYIINISSIKVGGPGLLFVDGSDQLGYAPMADWIRKYKIPLIPVSSPTLPDQAWLYILYTFDPRFGSFYFLALISWLIGQSGTFAFDQACSIILIAGYLGIAAIFSRSSRTFILLLAGILFCSWFEYSRSGYFGKIIGYSSAIFVIGLFLTNYKKELSQWMLLAYCILACAASIMYPGIVLTFLMILMGGMSLIIAIAFDVFSIKKFNFLNATNVNGLMVIILISIIALSTTGGLSKPAPFLNAYPHTFITWSKLLPAFTDIQSLVRENLFILFNNDTFLVYLTAFTLILSIIILIQAIRLRNVIAVTLIGAPVFLLFSLILFYAQAATYQLIGIFYVTTLCGFIWLMDDVMYQSRVNMLRMTHCRKTYVGLMILIVFMIGVRVPRYLEAIHRYVGEGVISTLQYSKAEFERLGQEIGDNIVTINLPAGAINYALPILVEFSQRKIQWSPETWRLILGFHPEWEPPKLKPARMMIILNKKAASRLNLEQIQPPKNCSIKYEMRQYQLLNCKA